MKLTVLIISYRSLEKLRNCVKTIGKNREIIITEKHIMNSMSDKIEEARYERTIKQNFASSISNKLSSELIIN